MALNYQPQQHTKQLLIHHLVMTDHFWCLDSNCEVSDLLKLSCSQLVWHLLTHNSSQKTHFSGYCCSLVIKTHSVGIQTLTAFRLMQWVGVFVCMLISHSGHFDVQIAALFFKLMHCVCVRDLPITNSCKIYFLICGLTLLTATTSVIIDKYEQLFSDSHRETQVMMDQMQL